MEGWRGGEVESCRLVVDDPPAMYRDSELRKTKPQVH